MFQDCTDFGRMKPGNTDLAWNLSCMPVTHFCGQENPVCKTKIMVYQYFSPGCVMQQHTLNKTQAPIYLNLKAAASKYFLKTSTVVLWQEGLN